MAVDSAVRGEGEPASADQALQPMVAARLVRLNGVVVPAAPARKWSSVACRLVRPARFTYAPAKHARKPVLTVFESPTFAKTAPSSVGPCAAMRRRFAATDSTMGEWVRPE